MMSSHLLAEIERVCDHLVIIEGELVQSGSISAFTGRIELLTVEVDGSAAALAAYLEERGYSYRERSPRTRSRHLGRRRVRRDPGRRGLARPRSRPTRAATPAARGPVPGRADEEPARV